ncbi:MAG: metal-dependent hydrolase [Polyangiales bacterium]
MTTDTLRAVPTPTQARPEIKVRRMDLEFPDEMPEFWFDGNPFLTALLSAMSVSFPAGERYFIASVRHFLPQIEDPTLRAEIRAFTGQEANHTKEHLAFNEMLERRGYPAKAMEAWVERRTKRLQKVSSPEANLARTAALEHFTAILAGAFIENPEVLATMSPEAATMWCWHAIEEIEHRAVAFDVYKQVVDDEALRLRTMRHVTVVFILVNLVRTAMLLRTSGHLTNVRAIAKGLDVLWARPGLLRRLLPQYLAYYRADFHPSQHDNSAQVEAAKARFLGALA